MAPSTREICEHHILVRLVEKKMGMIHYIGIYGISERRGEVKCNFHIFLTLFFLGCR